MAIKEIATLAEIPTLQEGNSIFVSFNETGADRYVVDVRRWYTNEEGEWRPTQKGISLPLAMVRQVSDALLEGLNEAAKLLPSNGAVEKAPAAKKAAPKAKLPVAKKNARAKRA